MPAQFRPGHDPGERPSSPLDSRILFVVVTLVMLGVIVVYATTYHRGGGYLVLHLVRVLAGAVAMAVAVFVNHALVWRRFRWLLLGGSAGLLVLTQLIGLACGVVKRDLPLWFISIQPAEFAKYGLLIWLAAYFTGLTEARREWSFRNSVLKPGLVVLGMAVLTLIQPSVGTTVILVSSCLVLFFLAGVSVRYLLPVAVAGAILVVAVVHYLPYANKRWKNFVRGNRYHQQQSLIAIGSGGPLGTGLGEGRQKFLFLPKMHNDFIFASVGEEFGFIGSLVVYALYALLFLRGMRVSRDATGGFGQLLSAGIAVMLLMYAVVHVAVALGLIPTTGQPLPFISYGGSALFTNMLAAGVLLNVSRFRRNRSVVTEPAFGWAAESRIGGAR